MPTTALSRPPAPRRRRLRSLADSFWVADLMLIALMVFFVALGAVNVFEATTYGIALGVLIVLYALHIASLARGRDGLTPEARRDRERRGF